LVNPKQCLLIAANCRNLQQLRKQSDDSVSPSNDKLSIKPHLPAFPDASKEEIFNEYTNFWQNLHCLVECEKAKVINTVKTYLKIDNILHNIHELDFDKLLHIGGK
jgi:hypothetical protein